MTTKATRLKVRIRKSRQLAAQVQADWVMTPTGAPEKLIAHNPATLIPEPERLLPESAAMMPETKSHDNISFQGPGSIGAPS